jgi:hypothetical protein
MSVRVVVAQTLRHNLNISGSVSNATLIMPGESHTLQKKAEADAEG